jgi:RNA-directed DNA polymerase
MSRLQQLKSAQNLHHVAALLGFKASALAYILYKKTDTDKYKDFEIKKHFGGIRKISAPVSELKLLQRNLSDLLQDCADEISQTNGARDRIAHGFKRDRSIISNAREHRNRRYVFNVDLTDFFGSINFGRVRGFFIKDNNFALHPSVATIVAQIACRNNSLPQGSPCSPIISNLIGHVLDIHLVQLAARTGVTYTRYADDLTFSTNRPMFPSKIAEHDPQDEHNWMPGRDLARLVTRCGFAINPLKTRMQYHDSRQEVTGLVVNRKINVRTEYRRRVRAMVHRLFTTGDFEILLRSKDATGTAGEEKVTGTPNQLRGMLGFIDEVDRMSIEQGSLSRISRDQRLTSKESMYRRFLLFKEFYAATSPVIVCEGKTDNVYIRHAIRRLAASYPQLATTTPEGTTKLHVRIFKYTESSTGRILRLHGGVGDLKQFMLDYHQTIAKFKAPGKVHPVVVLIDNDSGADAIFSAVKQITSARPDRNQPFVHVTANLYLVPLPNRPGKKHTAIEDFFDKQTRAIQVDGRSFDPSEEKDTTTHYSKNTFAEKVVKAQAHSIDFSGFDPVLSRVVAVIDAHTQSQRLLQGAS